MKRQLFTIGGAALFVMICLSGNAPAQTTPPSEEIVGDRQEIRQDRDELRQDPRELREDRRELREDLRSGTNPEQLQEDRREIRDDRRDMRNDRQDFRQGGQPGRCGLPGQDVVHNDLDRPGPRQFQQASREGQGEGEAESGLLAGDIAE